MLLGVLQRGSQQVAGILVLLLLLASLASWPACLAGISMSESPPKARTRFIYSIPLLLHGMQSEIVFNQLCSVLLHQLLSSLAVSISLSLSLSARIAVANAALTRELAA